MITIIVIQQALLAPKWRKDGPDVYWGVNGKLHHIDPIHKWPLFYFCSVSARIPFNLAHDNELANLHKDKRIMNCQPFMNNAYGNHELHC